ncbi:MAG: type I restriction enzyme HsdR N-terminal domain-containing protein [Bacteroidales bacterium]|nr:type I restriction enzyme HsdR N-terminal domain-containing protein [Bacteroidales bacterium]
MIKLNLPAYDFRLREINSRKEIYDPLRKKYIVLTPEEWVRQHFIQYLVHERQYPSSLLAVEKQLKLYRLQKRADIVAHSRSGNPLLIVECKAPQVTITQSTFDQIVNYNMTLKVRYLVITNGMTHYCCKVDWENNQYTFLESIPDYKMLTQD